MDCLRCGHPNAADARFCAACGGPALGTCGRCGLALAPGSQLCDACGAPAPVRSRREPRSYTPGYLVDRILRARHLVAGERKQVTVLFGEIQRGDDGEGPLEPSALQALRDDLFATLVDAIHRFEGSVQQYTDEGVMALFGAPLALEDHARRAALAALHARDRLGEQTGRLKRRSGLAFTVRIGLNSGEVVVGGVGDDLRMAYEAHGQTVSLASRMLQLADPGRIYASEATAALLGTELELRDLGGFELRGLRTPQRVHELRAIQPGAHLPIASTTQAPLMGRDRELGLLDALLDRTARGRGGLVCIEGAAGVGKSRLCAEFVARCREAGLDVLQARTPSYGSALPFAPVLAILRQYFDLAPDDTEQLARNKIAGASLLADRELEDDLPLLFDFLGVPDPDLPAPGLDPERRMTRLLDVASRLAHAGSRRGPAVVLVEDLHWIDPGSDLFVREVARIAQTSSMLLLVNYRPGYDASWTRATGCERIELRPLPEDDARRLLGALLGPGDSVRALRERLLERGAGNPFFLIEMVRGLADSGQLVGSPGHYRLEVPGAQIRVPARVQSLVAARIDRLPEAQKQLLQDAAAIGASFAGSLLARASGYAEPALRTQLRALVDGGFLLEAVAAPGEYTFAHPLIQEVAYETQLADSRAERHRRIARALLPMQPDHENAGAALVAYHLEEGGDCLAAARWHQRAVRWLARSDPAAARRHVDRVRTQLGKVAESPEALALRVEACASVLGLGWRFGTSEADAALLFEEGSAAAERLGEPRAQAMLWILYGNLRGSAGDIRSWYELPGRAAELARRAGDATFESWARGVEALGLISTGRLDETLRAVDASLRTSGDVALAGFVEVPLRAAMLAVRATVYGYRGRLLEAERELDTATGLAAERGADEALGHLHGWRSRLALARGDGAAALVHGRRCLALAEQTGSAHVHVLARLALGSARALLGEWSLGREELERGLELARSQRAALNLEANLLAPLASCLVALGEREGALHQAEHALALARERGQRLLEPEVQCARAQVLLAGWGLARADAAEAALLDAESMAEELGVRCEDADIALGRAQLLAMRGRRDEARATLEAAQRRARAGGAEGHAERIGRLLGDA